MDAVWYDSKEAVVKELRPYLNEDVVILVKGSRAMTMDTIVHDLQEEE